MAGNFRLKENCINRLAAFIPGNVSNKFIIRLYDVLRKMQKLSRKKFDHLSDNTKNFHAHLKVIENNKGYIEDQNRYADLKYGKSDMSKAGCGIIATYNALFSIHGVQIVSLDKLIHEFEKDGLVLNGKMGTAPAASMDFFKKRGYKTSLETDHKKFDEIGSMFNTFILTIYNDINDISKEIHTINISKDQNGKYRAHNTYCNGLVLGPYNSLSETIANINGGKAKGISLIGISPVQDKTK